MADSGNLSLYVASYADASSAQADFASVKDADAASDDFKVKGAVVMSRGADGTVDVLESGAANEDTATGAWIGGGIGLVVGLFAPPLLMSTAIGAGIGALVGHMAKKHEEKELGVDLEEYFPPNSSAVVVVAEDQYADRIESALDGADKKISKAIDKDDYDALKKAIEEGTSSIEDAIES